MRNDTDVLFNSQQNFNVSLGVCLEVSHIYDTAHTLTFPPPLPDEEGTGTGIGHCGRVVCVVSALLCGNCAASDASAYDETGYSDEHSGHGGQRGQGTHGHGHFADVDIHSR